MKFRHLHSIKEVPYGLFTLHVQLDFTIGDIIIMNVFQYIENNYISNGTYNWWLDLALIVVILVFDALHYMLALVIPIVLYKSKNIFNFRIGLLSVVSVLIANIVLFLELGEVDSQVTLNNIPQYMSTPICVTMATVIIVSILIIVKEKSNVRK
jgi:hypothetical protein